MKKIFKKYKEKIEKIVGQKDNQILQISAASGVGFLLVAVSIILYSFGHSTIEYAPDAIWILLVGVLYLVYMLGFFVLAEKINKKTLKITTLVHLVVILVFSLFVYLN